MNKQSGGTILGFVMGLVVGLGMALAVAVYITKVPVQFLSKGQTRSPDQDAAETRKNKDWDPNAALSGKNPAKPASAAVAAPDSAVGAAAPATAAPASAQTPTAAAPPAPKRDVRPALSADPLGELVNARSAAASNEPFIYFVQVDAFRAPEAAESLRAKLALGGVEAKVTEREQSGRTVYRVRVGPFDRKDDAEKAKQKLDTPDHETALVRVQR